MPLTEKNLPAATVKNVLPPVEHYTYFENAEQVPFRPAATGFDLANAWWLMEASMLAYSDEPFVVDCFGRAGLPRVRLFSGRVTQCYVAHNDELVVVAFRGTQIRPRPGTLDYREVMLDWLSDFRVRPVQSGQGCRVHEGFKRDLDEVWWGGAGLEQYLEQVRGEGGRDRKVWLTGHSLGAALATLAARRYTGVQGLYTYGSPRVGDTAFGDGFRRVSTYRFVNNNDIVPRVPPPGPFHHVGSVRYIDSGGNLHDDPALWARLKDGLRGELGHVVNTLSSLRSGWARLIPNDSLSDHAPLFYTIHVWNNLVRSLISR